MNTLIILYVTFALCCVVVVNGYNVPASSNCATSMSAFPPDPESGCCGIDESTGHKIIGGLTTQIDEYPWSALIEYVKDDTEKTYCGGALISGKYVMTAAHCVTGPVLAVGTPTNVILGEYDTKQEGPDCVSLPDSGVECTEGVTRIPIETIIIHPEYRTKGHRNTNSWNDIALIRLKELAPYTDFIRPICLPTVNITQRTDSLDLIEAGWGRIDNKDTNNSVKRQISTNFVPREQCKAAYENLKIKIGQGQFCAGGHNGHKFCKGNSGAPLMHINGRTYEAAGIVSMGPANCNNMNVNIPDVATNVYEYNSWIRSTIVA